MIFSSKQKSFFYINKYRKKSEYSYYSTIFYSEEKGIKYIQPFSQRMDLKVNELMCFYYYLNNIQKLENKNTYLITLTNTDDMLLVTKFITKLRNLKNGKGKFSGIEFDYFAILEPTKNGDPHIHIKLVIDKIWGIRKWIEEKISELEHYSIKHIKKEGLDKNNYLAKNLAKENKEEYIGWLIDKDITLSQATYTNRYINIDEHIKLTIKDYRFMFWYLRKIENISGKIDHGKVKEYLLSLSDEYKKYHCLLKEIKDKEFLIASKKVLEDETLDKEQIKKLTDKLKKKRSVRFKEVFKCIKNINDPYNLRDKSKKKKVNNSKSKQILKKLLQELNNKHQALIIAAFMELIISEKTYKTINELQRSLYRYIKQVLIIVLLITNVEARARSPSFLLKKLTL